MRCEAAEKMRSDCERVLAIGTEQEKRIGLLQEEIARIQEERKGSAVGETKSLAGNLSKEISGLQEKYERASSKLTLKWKLFKRTSLRSDQSWS